MLGSSILHALSMNAFVYNKTENVLLYFNISVVHVQVGQQGPVSGTTDRALPHARLQLEPQQKRSKQQPPAEPNLPLEMVEPQLPPCQQPQTQQVLQHMRLPPLPQQQQQQGRVQQQAAPLTLQVPSPEARRASLAVAGACGGNTGVCIKERSSSGGLISPRTGSSGVLGLQDLTSPTPYAPKYYISHEGTIAASSQQRKQLMLSIPRVSRTITTLHACNNTPCLHAEFCME